MAQRKLVPFVVAEKQPLRAAVVQLGRDPYLLGLRARVIASVGLQVRSIAPNELCAETSNARSPQIWIFCHSIEFHEFIALAAMVRRNHPVDKLLRLSGLYDNVIPARLVDRSLDAPTTVDQLLQAVTNREWHPLAVKRPVRYQGEEVTKEAYPGEDSLKT